ncbi:nuclear transport factor 2 family protein [Lysobacter sp. D1-1-M9]
MGPVRGHNLPEAAKPTELPDAALPADLDRVLRDFERAWRADDAKALASLFAADGFVLQSNRTPVRGRLAIETAYKGQAGGPLRLRALAFAAGDTAGYIIGAYRYGDAPRDIGKFTLTLHRLPGQPWLIFSDMDNLDRPPKPRPAPDTASPSTPQSAGH